MNAYVTPLKKRESERTSEGWDREGRCPGAIQAREAEGLEPAAQPDPHLGRAQSGGHGVL